MTQRDQTILVVDPEARFRQSFVLTLQHAFPDVGVFEADGGRSAVDLVKQRSFGVVLLDLHTRLDGVPLVNRLVAKKAPTAVILVSAHATPEEERGVLVNGGFALVKKPIELENLVATIRALLRAGTTQRHKNITVLDLYRTLLVHGDSLEVGIVSNQKKGRLSFRGRKLVCALTENQEGEAALLEILKWGRVDAEVTQLVQDLGVVCKRGFVEPAAVTRITEEAKPRRSPLQRPTGRTPLQGVGAARSPAPQGTTGKKAPKGLPPVPQPQSAKDTNNLQENSNNRTGSIHMAKFNFSKATGLDGFIGVSLVEVESGMSLAAEGGGGLNLDLAAAANAEVVKAKRRAMSVLGLNDKIEDILITLGKHYHLIRPLAQKQGYFIYLAIDRSRANLAMARAMLAEVEKNLEF